MFAGRPPARIPVEASTESEWGAQHLESLGHEVIVADPNFAPMYATLPDPIMRRGQSAAIVEREQSGETSLVEPEATCVEVRGKENA